jgi:hypothetical protein
MIVFVPKQKPAEADSLLSAQATSVRQDTFGPKKEVTQLPRQVRSTLRSRLRQTTGHIRKVP